MTHELYSIFFSHYVEKARWALERFGVPYREKRYLPLFHFPPVIWARRGRGGSRDRASSPFSTPLLMTETGEAIQDSGDICRWASDRFAPEGTGLYPDREVEAWEQYLHDKLGPHTRRVIYHFALGSRRDMMLLAQRNVGKKQVALFRACYPLFTVSMSKALSINPVKSARSWDRCREVFAEIDARRQGRTYLVGDRFTAADLSLACMASPVLMLGKEFGYGAHLPLLDELEPEPRQMIEEFRATPTGQHVMALFRSERGRVVS